MQLNKKVESLLKDFGIDLKELDYKYPDFFTSKKTIEPCSYCDGDEVEITLDGKSDCPQCGDKEALPCMECPLHDLSLCDWNPETRCSAFPIN